MSTNRPLQRMFESVPLRYDLINHIFTFGLDSRWRMKAVYECLSNNPKRILDLCCGTGDMALSFFSVKSIENSDACVIGLDYSIPMLNIAVQKKVRRGVKTLDFVLGDASCLPVWDNCLDCVSISFAFRNMMYKNPLSSKHLKEVLRVLRPGGRYVIIESSQPTIKIIKWFFRKYLNICVYRLGWYISGNKAAYKYLSQSASEFYTAEEVKLLLLNAGFRNVDFKRLFFGAVCIHVATK